MWDGVLLGLYAAAADVVDGGGVCVRGYAPAGMYVQMTGDACLLQSVVYPLYSATAGMLCLRLCPFTLHIGE